MTKSSPQKNRKMKASGVEWIGDIPEGWEVVKNRYLFVGRKGSVLKLEKNSNSLPYLSAEFMRSKKNIEYGFGKTVAEIGDILLLWDGANAGEYFLVKEKGVVSSTFVKIVPTLLVLNFKYYFWVNKSFEKILQEYTQGMGIPHVSQLILKDNFFPTPLKETQKKIAQFLDKRTGGISELIEKKKRMIELLREKRSSVITHAVTKGIEPGVPMKASGVEWIGDIPEGWEVKPLKTVFYDHSSGVWGDEEKYDDNDMVCVRVADFDFSNLSVSEKKLTIRNIPNNQLDKILKNGDILLEKSGGGEKTPVGRSVLFDLQKQAVCSNFVEKMPINGTECHEFIKYTMAALYIVGQNTKSIKQTTGIQNLDIKNYLKEITPNPNIETQETIAEFLDEKTSEIDSVITKIEKQLTLLDEYRASLIYHAVTGKIEV